MIIYNMPCYLKSLNNKYNIIRFDMNDKELKKQLGLKIKEFRVKKKLTQENLAEKINWTQRQISLIELGISFPNPETLSNLLEVFNCSPKELFEFETNDEVLDLKNLKQKLLNNIEKLSNDKIQILYKMSKII